jgi:hypothetical protein
MNVRRIVPWLLMASAFVPVVASAGQAARLRLAARLLDAMQMSKTVEDQFAMIRDMQKGMMTQMVTQMGMPPDALSGVEAVQEEVAQVVAHDLSWEAAKASYTEIYASTFSESELKGLIAFYHSPAGRALVLKTPDLTAKTMEIGQRQLATLLPKIQEIVRKYQPTPVSQ